MLLCTKAVSHYKSKKQKKVNLRAWQRIWDPCAATGTIHGDAAAITVIEGEVRILLPPRLGWRWLLEGDEEVLDADRADGVGGDELGLDAGPWWRGLATKTRLPTAVRKTKMSQCEIYLMRIWKSKGVDLRARQRSCGALDVREKTSGHAAESSASKRALLLHLVLTRVCEVESEGGGVEHEELVDDGSGDADKPLDDLAALVEVVLQVVDLGLGKNTRIEDRESWKCTATSRRLWMCCCLRKQKDSLVVIETEAFENYIKFLGPDSVNRDALLFCSSLIKSVHLSFTCKWRRACFWY
jgi:hypothetical protein